MLVERLAVSHRRSASVLCLSPFIWTMAVKPLLVQLGLVVLLTDETLTGPTHWCSDQQGSCGFDSPSLHVVPVSARVLSRFSGFLPQLKKKLQIVCRGLCVNGFVFQCDPAVNWQPTATLTAGESGDRRWLDGNLKGFQVT